MTARQNLTITACCLVPMLAAADTLDIYQDLTGKTVLMSSAVQGPPLSLVPDPVRDKTNAIATIERWLGEKGIEVVADGPDFVRLFPKSAEAFATNRPLRGAQLLPGETQKSAQGMIDFTGADINQVLEIYADMRQRTILRPVTLPAPSIRLRTLGGLSWPEGIYALETVLALNGISVVDDGPKFIQVVPFPQRVLPHAPKPDSDARVFNPKKVPETGMNRITVPPRPRNEVEQLEQAFERLRQAFYEYLNPAKPAKRPVERLLALYARLTDKTVVVTKASSQFYGIPVRFQVTTPLTKAELIYAIETTFALNNLAIIAVSADKVRVGHISEAGASSLQQAKDSSPTNR